MIQEKRGAVYGIGTYLPRDVRRNDWWPRSIVEKWEEKLALKKEERAARPTEHLSEGARLTIAAIAEYAHDPFKGCVERRVIPPSMFPSEMGVLAGKEALRTSGIAPDRIGALLTYVQLPDYLAIPAAPLIHHELGLPHNCFTLTTDSACNSFQTQLSLADQMIKAGTIEFALLVQATALQQIIRPEEQQSAWFGDGATAVVVGPAKSDSGGFIASAHFTDGSLYRALVGGCRSGGRWFDRGDFELYFEDREASVRLALSLPDFGKQVLDDVFKRTGYTPRDVDFYAAHQGTHWFRRVTQEYIGLINASFFDSYAWTASLSAANLPFCMAMAEKEGLLKPGDLVAMYSGGSGVTVSGTLMRWGTGA